MEELTIKGNVHIVHRNKEGEILHEEKKHNMIVKAGRDWLCAIMGDTFTGHAPSKYIALSNDGTAITLDDTTIASEIVANGLSRAIGTYQNHAAGGRTYEITKTFTATGAQSCQKSGLFDASSSGSLLAALLFTQVNLNTNDTLAITWQIDVGA